MSNNQVIELNGNKYDAVTGKVIANSSAPRQPSSEQTNRAATAHPPTTKVSTRPARPNSVSSVRQQPAKSHTLMRSAVKKPANHPIHTITGRRPAQAKVAVPKHKKVISPASIDSINPHRIARAQNTMKSSLVSKFGHQPNKHMAVAEVPVKQTPAKHPRQQSVVHANPTSVAPQARVHNPFDEALKTAVSHEQPKLKKQRFHHKIARKLGIKPRTLLIGIGGASLIIAGGFIAYTHVPSVALKVASTKAGINATLPAYQPAGFSLEGPISTAPGEVSLSYKSNSDNRDFKVTQKTSSWNSETLLSNLATVSKQTSYQTFQSGGRTIYIYDGGNATWVDGGIWYKIEGNSSLNSDQLLRIANSL